MNPAVTPAIRHDLLEEMMYVGFRGMVEKMIEQMQTNGW